uniref:Beta/gamma crystallin 'Greek key' domain-containing protein n=1 Tax=Chrysemys picta bellii TaxID=8478 RepID=A0A8C3FSG5_CHRPI
PSGSAPSVSGPARLGPWGAGSGQAAPAGPGPGPGSGPGGSGPGPGDSSSIVVYEHVDFEGLSREFTSDVPDLHELDFGDCICSLRVVGQPWIAYTAPKYEGDAYALEEGEYRTVEKNKAFSALRLVHHDLADPQITLYEEPDYAGQSKVVTEETNLTYGYFNDRVSSHVVQRGVWLLYKHPDRGGWYHIAWPGEHLPDYNQPCLHERHVSHDCFPGNPPMAVSPPHTLSTAVSPTAQPPTEPFHLLSDCTLPRQSPCWPCKAWQDAKQ